jgi:hypothetical protein
MMETRLVAITAAAGGLVIGVASAGLFMHAHAAVPNSVCPLYDAAADAKADAAVKQLHAHDHDQYVPHPASSPFGGAPKPANAEPAKDSPQ